MAPVTNHRASAIFLCLTLLTSTPWASADEGMWLYNNPPRALLHEKYGFELTDTARYSTGCWPAWVARVSGSHTWSRKKPHSGGIACAI
jgi:hypothetical protein